MGEGVLNKILYTELGNSNKKTRIKSVVRIYVWFLKQKGKHSAYITEKQQRKAYFRQEKRYKHHKDSIDYIGYNYMRIEHPLLVSAQMKENKKTPLLEFFLCKKEKIFTLGQGGET
jgi:hypothetical protein